MTGGGCGGGRGGGGRGGGGGRAAGQPAGRGGERLAAGLAAVLEGECIARRGKCRLSAELNGPDHLGLAAVLEGAGGRDGVWGSAAAGGEQPFVFVPQTHRPPCPRRESGLTQEESRASLRRASPPRGFVCS